MKCLAGGPLAPQTWVPQQSFPVFLQFYLTPLLAYSILNRGASISLVKSNQGFDCPSSCSLFALMGKRKRYVLLHLCSVDVKLCSHEWLILLAPAVPQNHRPRRGGTWSFAVYNNLYFVLHCLWGVTIFEGHPLLTQSFLCRPKLETAFACPFCNAGEPAERDGFLGSPRAT